MSKLYVVDGALLQCNQGMKPAKLLVTQNQKMIIQGKFKATDADNQVPETFGQCRLKPSSGGYLPCVPALQKWTKTTENFTLGSKKFLYDCSETMCATGGKITILNHGQINLVGSSIEEFKDISMIIPGAMLANDKAPKILESYWMDEDGKKKINKLKYGNKSALFVYTRDVDAGESITVKVKEKDTLKIDGKQTVFTYKGTVLEDGTAQLNLLETEEYWNKKS